MIWHEADITTQLVCIGVSVCRPLYKDRLNEFINKIGSSHRSNNSRSGSASSGGFGVIALKTIGGHSVVANGGNKEPCTKGTPDGAVDGGAVDVERSWTVESKGRTVALSRDTAGDIHVLGDAGPTDVDQKNGRQA